eukprot:scaffold75472_cov40-Tisochrysis_lutea.AAC.2
MSYEDPCAHVHPTCSAHAQWPSRLPSRCAGTNPSHQLFCSVREVTVPSSPRSSYLSSDSGSDPGSSVCKYQRPYDDPAKSRRACARQRDMAGKDSRG